MNRRSFASAVLANLILAANVSAADKDPKLPTIGLAIPVDAATDAPFQRALREGLRDLGYIDGKNIRLIVRYADGDPKKLRTNIRELIDLKVDVLHGDAPVLKEATTSIPIVSPTMGDPVKTGLVASLAHPGGNLTGLSSQRYETDPKLLELTKELLPKLKSLCLLFDDEREPNLVDYANNDFRALAHGLGVSVHLIPVRTLNDIQTVPKTLERIRPQAALIWASAFMYQHRKLLVGPVARHLPVVGDGQVFLETGAIVTYSVDWLDMFRRSATHVDKILKGAKPAELPIEQPTKFKLIVNLKSARKLGIKVPESILLRADEVIR